jgi:uncharacterized protein YfbU (UPF0304 family)
VPTITLRLDDATKEELEALARGRGQSLSDLIRSALDGLLMRDEDQDRLDVAPRSLTAMERQQLSLLHRILARLVDDDNDVDGDKAYQLERAEVLENGFVREYSTEFAGIYPELSARDSEFVVDVLDLFRTATFSIQRLQADGVELEEKLVNDLRFEGFDLNDSRESHLLTYARYLVSDGRWSELLYAFSDENDSGNSHAQLADMYQRMLDEHSRIKAEKGRDRVRRDSYLLGADELQRLADAQVHPDNRR